MSLGLWPVTIKNGSTGAKAQVTPVALFHFRPLRSVR